jgi:hypothetical protein
MPRDNSGESPTITDVDEELRLFPLSMPPEHIRQQRPVFSEILDALSLSHTQAFFGLDSSNKPSFVQFADWLVLLAQSFEGAGKQDVLKSAADPVQAEPSLARH